MEKSLLKGNFPVETKTVTCDVLEKPAEILVSKFRWEVAYLIFQFSFKIFFS